MRSTRAALLILLPMVASSARGAVYLPISDQELVDRAEVIVLGFVIGEESEACDYLGPVCTRYRIAVTRRLKGDLGGDPFLALVVPGGRLTWQGHEASLEHSASPILSPGDEVLLFVERVGTGPEPAAYRLGQLALGAFVVARDRAGDRRLALRQAGTTRQAREADRFVDAIAETVTTGAPLEPARYLVEVSDKTLLLWRPKNVQECPELPVLVSMRWYLKGDVNGFTFPEMRQAITEGLAAWNDEVSAINIPFLGRGAQTDPVDLRDGISVIVQDDRNFIEDPILAAAAHSSVCDTTRGVREIRDAFVFIGTETGETLSIFPDPVNVMAEIMAHEFGHTLSLGHSCGGPEEPMCDTPYLDDATMRAFIHADGRGGSLRQWDMDSIHARFSNNPSPCTADTTALCLNRGRFRVEVRWRDFQGHTGSGTAVPIDGVDDSGLFWFFSSDNIEFLVKVLSGCTINNHYWVFAAATTNVEYTLTVTDTAIGFAKEYENPLGRAAPSIVDTAAFATCP